MKSRILAAAATRTILDMVTLLVDRGMSDEQVLDTAMTRSGALATGATLLHHTVEAISTG